MERMISLLPGLSMGQKGSSSG